MFAYACVSCACACMCCACVCVCARVCVGYFLVSLWSLCGCKCVYIFEERALCLCVIWFLFFFHLFIQYLIFPFCSFVSSAEVPKKETQSFLAKAAQELEIEAKDQKQLQELFASNSVMPSATKLRKTS